MKEINLIDDINFIFSIRYFQRNKIKLVSIHSSKCGILGRIACLIITPCIFTAQGGHLIQPLTFQSKIFILEFITQLIPRKLLLFLILIE